MTIRTERITFAGARGDRLAARLERPAGRPAAYALFAHCFTCSKDLKAIRAISRTLAEEGLATLRFDFTGLGESEGDFAETTFSSNLDDLVAAADYLRENEEAPRLLIGHSLGGTAVLAASRRIAESRAVCTIAAPAGTAHLERMLRQRAPEIEAAGEAEVDLAGRTFRITKRLLDDLQDQPLQQAINELGKPLLIFHSPADGIVGIDQARQIFEAARHPKSFISLDRADHLLLDNKNDAPFVGRTLAAWARRYAVDQGSAEEAPAGEHGEVVVEGGSSGYTQRIVAGRHVLTADEPEDHGGSDAGPNPYELLLAGLGACTSMTLRMYADRKQWPLEGIRVRLRHERVHAEDCADCETREGKVDRIERELALEGDLTDEQRQRLLEIADRCPVSRTLTSETRIEDGLV